ncbi:putative tetratricopeptide repeat-containing protein [Rickettsiales endosymbiont of Paramecium tredecaurelia]|uniref:tetratricopeptide repeat protein n=1 Tax=Candidatus Sarmatiella mevalonica TaxID=2770581 RepID=UPI0019245200|nr:tetratricopeptide repeat protein [Candidatus Sarmatiella mevalonica]MBL3285155.1 putative tetratricopeptide repeat-containing protein [Candidatus Sarmatiella mevalonica]
MQTNTPVRASSPRQQQQKIQFIQQQQQIQKQESNNNNSLTATKLGEYIQKYNDALANRDLFKMREALDSVTRSSNKLQNQEDIELTLKTNVRMKNEIAQKQWICDTDDIRRVLTLQLAQEDKSILDQLKIRGFQDLASAISKARREIQIQLSALGSEVGRQPKEDYASRILSLRTKITEDDKNGQESIAKIETKLSILERLISIGNKYIAHKTNEMSENYKQISYPHQQYTSMIKLMMALYPTEELVQKMDLLLAATPDNHYLFRAVGQCASNYLIMHDYAAQKLQTAYALCAEESKSHSDRPELQDAFLRLCTTYAYEACDALIKAEKPQEVSKFLLELGSVTFRSAELLTCLGKCLMNQENYGEAKTIFENALKIDYKNYISHLSIARIYAKHADYSSAAKCMETAIKCTTPAPHFWYNELGQYHTLQYKNTNAHADVVAACSAFYDAFTRAKKDKDDAAAAKVINNVVDLLLHNSSIAPYAQLEQMSNSCRNDQLFLELVQKGIDSKTNATTSLVDQK